jgi:hypothetical protein
MCFCALDATQTSLYLQQSVEEEEEEEAAC